MKITCCVNACLWLSFFCCSEQLFAGDAPPPAAPPAPAAKAVTLTGTFFWINKKDTKPDIKAVLTPTAANEYTVAYTFTWKKQDQSWKGTFKGNPQNGDVSGTGVSMDGKRTFIFKGKAVNGVLTCKHYETTGRNEMATGEVSFKL